MTLKLRRLLFAGCATLVFLSARAEVAVPPLVHRVTDLTATLTAEQTRTLEQTLAAYEAKTGAQIAVLIVPTTKPEEIEEYSIRVVDQWKLGRKNVDDGVLLLVAKDDRRVRIEVGYGLEGILPDAIANRIIEEEITPRFRVGDFYGGILAGTDRIMRVINGESLSPPSETPQRSINLQSLLMPGLILVFVIAGVLRAIFGRLLGAGVVGTIAAVAIWFVMGTLVAACAAGVIAFLAALVGGTSGRWGGYYLGGGGGGGWGGGGFSGGGGGFGGGGASGRW